jgi:hypothetical protein
VSVEEEEHILGHRALKSLPAARQEVLEMSDFGQITGKYARLVEGAPLQRNRLKVSTVCKIRNIGTKM